MAEEFSRRSLAGARFHQANLAGARFHQVNLAGAPFEGVYLADAFFRAVELSGAKSRGSYLRNVEISGELDGLRVNGIEVGPLVEAELDRRYPERAKLRPADAAGFREAWEVIEQLWAETVDRSEQLEEALLHERVDGEWSFIETLPHLVLAT